MSNSTLTRFLLVDLLPHLLVCFEWVLHSISDSSTPNSSEIRPIIIFFLVRTLFLVLPRFQKWILRSHVHDPCLPHLHSVSHRPVLSQGSSVRSDPVELDFYVDSGPSRYIRPCRFFRKREVSKFSEFSKPFLYIGFYSYLIYVEEREI